MNLNLINNFTNSYIKNNPNSWIGIHDCHKHSLGIKILKTGLSVSHNPFGRKIKYFKDENGNIDLTNNFMTTMYHINEKQFEFTSIPVEPVFVNIPFEVLKELNLDPKKESSYQSICVFGKMTIETDDSRLIIDRTVQQCEEKEANIRLLPTYFISGYIDTKSNEFIENPNYFSNLSEQEKNSIIQVLKNQKEQLEQRNQNQKS